MSTQQFSNYVSTTLNGAITSGAVSLVVSSATGFPTVGNFQIIIDNNEICQVTAVTGTTFTVTRAYEAINGIQVASAHANGAPVVIVLTAQGLSLGFARLDQGNTFVGAETFNNDVTFGARALFSTAVSKIVPGATSISLRNNADSADNLIITDAGDVTVRARLLMATAVSKIVPGATSISLRNNADNANNILVADAGTVTLRNNLVIAGTLTGATNVPLGTIAYAQVLADQAAITVITDLTGLTVTFTAVAGRRYRVTAKIEVTASVADGAYVVTLADGANTALQRATDGCLTTAARSVNLAYVEVPGGGSITRKLRLSKAGGTGTLTGPYGGGPAFILVEDIGT